MCIRSYWNPSLSAKQHEIIWWFGVFDGVLLLLSLLVLFLFCFFWRVGGARVEKYRILLLFVHSSEQLSK